MPLVAIKLNLVALSDLKNFDRASIFVFIAAYAANHVDLVSDWSAGVLASSLVKTSQLKPLAWLHKQDVNGWEGGEDFFFHLDANVSLRGKCLEIHTST